MSKWYEAFRKTTLILCYGITKITFRSSFDNPGVLVYHSIDAKAPSVLRSSTTPQTFMEQMEYLRQHYNIVSLEDVRKYVDEGLDLPKNSLAITFDDGFFDNYSVAYPYLKQHNLPATIFVATSYTGDTYSPKGVIELQC